MEVTRNLVGRPPRARRMMMERLASEQGSVGVVVALVIFLVLGMLTMTWNTAQLSKAKMRLQNAADSAALAHAIWQARGMNAVQNINDEMYEALSLAVKLRNVAKVVEPIAIGFDAASAAPFRSRSASTRRRRPRSWASSSRGSRSPCTR